MNYDEKAHSLWLEIINRTVTQDMVLSALKEVSAQALRDVCDELIEKYEGQGKTMTTAVMHIRAEVAELRRGDHHCNPDHSCGFCGRPR